MMPQSPAGVELYAPFVCVNCKARKKRCTKERPSCSYCVSHSLICFYTPLPSTQSQFEAAAYISNVDLCPSNYASRRPSDFREFDGPGTRGIVVLMDSFLSIVAPHLKDSQKAAESMPVDAAIYLQVGQIIAAYGKYIDEISVNYFRGVHRWLPILSRRRFHDRLMGLHGPPIANFSVLVMAMCLVTDRSSQRKRPHMYETLYLATKALFAHAQSYAPTSIDLIQAGLLIATYEYAHGSPDPAYVSVGVCARMAHVLGLPSRMIRSTENHNRSNTAQDRSAESHNLVWGIVLCDRFIVSETSEVQRPFAMEFPTPDVNLPVELDHIEANDRNPNLACSFAREAQAAYFYERVLKQVTAQDLQSRFSALMALDREIQDFLGEIMAESASTWGLYCGSITFAIGALFTFHGHIIEQGENSDQSTRLLSVSNSALLSTSRIVVDIARGFNKERSRISVEQLPPRYAHLVKAALFLLAHSTKIPADMEIEHLRAMLKHLGQRWGVADRHLQLLDQHVKDLR